MMPETELENLPTGVSLRPLEEEDMNFLRSLFAETTAELFAHLPLPPAQKLHLLELQLRAREEGWRAQHPDARFQIVCAEGEFAGYFAHHHGNEKVQLIYLGLLQNYQGRGIAKALIRALQNDASLNNLPIAAHVEHGNPALEFWKHQGFDVLESVGAYYSIQWSQSS